MNKLVYKTPYKVIYLDHEMTVTLGDDEPTMLDVDIDEIIGLMNDAGFGLGTCHDCIHRMAEVIPGKEYKLVLTPYGGKMEQRIFIEKTT